MRRINKMKKFDSKKWRMKKLFILGALILSLVIPMVDGINIDNNISTVQAALKITISKKKASIYVGKTLTLKIKGTKKKPKWSSNKKSVATVSSKGKVRAKKKGVATITAKIGKEKYTCKVTVKKLPIFKVSSDDIKITKNKSKKIIVTYNGKGTLEYEIEDEAICSCKWKKGWQGNKCTLIITGKRKGDTIVRIKNDDDKRDIEIDVTVVSKQQPVQYGNIHGNISYYYNKYYGNRADTGAYIILIPKNGAAKNISNISKYDYNNSNLKNASVYITKADGNGNYKISHVATGEYRVLLISNKTNSGVWFDASESNTLDSYYNNIANYFTPEYLSYTAAKNLAEDVSFYKYHIEDITIYNNEDIQLSHDFGITYI